MFECEAVFSYPTQNRGRTDRLGTLYIIWFRFNEKILIKNPIEPDKSPKTRY